MPTEIDKVESCLAVARTQLDGWIQKVCALERYLDRLKADPSLEQLMTEVSNAYLGGNRD